MSSSAIFKRESFVKQLIGLNDRQESIQTLALWVIRNASHHVEIVNTWLETFKRGTERQRLNMLYVANDVIQNCRRKKAPQFRDEFKKVLLEAFMLCRNGAKVNSFGHIIDIWEQRAVFNEDMCAELKIAVNYKPKLKKGPEDSKTYLKTTSDSLDSENMSYSEASLGIKEESSRNHRVGHYDLETVTSYIYKHGKRKKEMETQLREADEMFKFLTTLKQPHACDRTLQEIFPDCEYLKQRLEDAYDCLEKANEAIMRKMKHDQGLLRHLHRARSHLREDFKKAKDLEAEQQLLLKCPAQLKSSLIDLKRSLRQPEVSPVSLSSPPNELSNVFEDYTPINAKKPKSENRKRPYDPETAFDALDSSGEGSDSQETEPTLLASSASSSDFNKSANSNAITFNLGSFRPVDQSPESEFPILTEGKSGRSRKKSLSSKKSKRKKSKSRSRDQNSAGDDSEPTSGRTSRSSTQKKRKKKKSKKKHKSKDFRVEETGSRSRKSSRRDSEKEEGEEDSEDDSPTRSPPPLSKGVSSPAGNTFVSAGSSSGSGPSTPKSSSMTLTLQSRIPVPGVIPHSSPLSTPVTPDAASPLTRLSARPPRIGAPPPQPAFAASAQVQAQPQSLPTSNEMTQQTAPSSANPLMMTGPPSGPPPGMPVNAVYPPSSFHGPPPPGFPVPPHMTGPPPQMPGPPHMAAPPMGGALPSFMRPPPGMPLNAYQGHPQRPPAYSMPGCYPNSGFSSSQPFVSQPQSAPPAAMYPPRGPPQPPVPPTMPGYMSVPNGYTPASSYPAPPLQMPNNNYMPPPTGPTPQKAPNEETNITITPDIQQALNSLLGS